MIAGSEQQLGGAQQIDDVLAGAGPGLGRLLVRDERIGGQRQRFIEQEQREQVGGEGHAHRGGKRQREAGEVAGLRVLAERAHVADRVERGGDPEKRCAQGKQQAKAIDTKCDLDAGKEPEEHAFRRATRHDLRDHRRDKPELQDSGRHGPEFPQIARRSPVPTMSSGAADQRPRGSPGVA